MYLVRLKFRKNSWPAVRLRQVARRREEAAQSLRPRRRAGETGAEETAAGAVSTIACAFADLSESVLNTFILYLLSFVNLQSHNVFINLACDTPSYLKLLKALSRNDEISVALFSGRVFRRSLLRLET